MRKISFSIVVLVSVLLTSCVFVKPVYDFTIINNTDYEVDFICKCYPYSKKITVAPRESETLCDFEYLRVDIITENEGLYLTEKGKTFTCNYVPPVTYKVINKSFYKIKINVDKTDFVLKNATFDSSDNYVLGESTTISTYKKPTDWDVRIIYSDDLTSDKLSDINDYLLIR